MNSSSYTASVLLDLDGAEAARKIGARCVAVRTGGFGDQRLLHAGADDVVDDPRALVGRP